MVGKYVSNSSTITFPLSEHISSIQCMGEGEMQLSDPIGQVGKELSEIFRLWQQFSLKSLRIQFRKLVVTSS